MKTVKRKKIQSVTVSEWEQALCAATVDVVPPEWKSCMQLAQELGRSDSQIRHLIARSLKEGVIEMKKFRVATGGRGPYPTPHYRIVKKHANKI